MFPVEENFHPGGASHQIPQQQTFQIPVAEYDLSTSVDSFGSFSDMSQVQGQQEFLIQPQFGYSVGHLQPMIALNEISKPAESKTRPQSQAKKTCPPGIELSLYPTMEPSHLSNEFILLDNQYESSYTNFEELCPEDFVLYGQYM